MKPTLAPPCCNSRIKAVQEFSADPTADVTLDEAVDFAVRLLLVWNRESVDVADQKSGIAPTNAVIRERWHSQHECQFSTCGKCCNCAVNKSSLCCFRRGGHLLVARRGLLRSRAEEVEAFLDMDRHALIFQERLMWTLKLTRHTMLKASSPDSMKVA